MIPIYERGKLSKQFIDFIKNEGVPDELLPYWHNNWGYRCDWNIIGGESAKELFEPYRSSNFPLSIQREVTSIVNRLSVKIFEPEQMIKSKTITDQVRLRIVVSMINKIEIPKDISDTIFDNMLITYWVRKRAYDVFFCKEIMQFPFAPDFAL